MIKKIIKIILVLLCMITIFSFSSDNGDVSSEKSDGIISYVSKKLVGSNVSDKDRKKYIDSYSYYLRKTAHFSIYLVLGILVISLVSEYTSINYIALLIAFVVSILYACSDEVHQLFVPGRSGEVLDILIDSLGSFIGIYLYYIFYKIRRKKYE